MKGCLLFLVPVAAAVAALFYLATDRAFEALWFPRLAEVAGVRATAREATWEPLSGFTARGIVFSSDGGVRGEIDEIQASWSPSALLRAAVSLNSLAVTGGRIECRPEAKPVRSEREEREDRESRGGEPTVLGFAVECGPVALRSIDIVVRSERAGGMCLTNRIDNLELSGWRGSAEVVAKGRASIAGTVWEGLELEGANLACDMKLGLSRRLEINAARGTMALDGCRGRSGALRLEGLAVRHTIEMSPFWLKSAVLTVSRGEKQLGRLAASGAVDFNLKTCDVVVLLEDVGPDVVNVVTASKGLWMTSGSLRMNGQCQLLKQSRRLQGEAVLQGACFDRKPGVSAAPPIEGRAGFALEYFPAKQEMVVERAQVSLVEGTTLLAAAGMDRPMHLSWGEGGEASGGSELALRIPENDLGRFSHFTEAAWGARIESGVVAGSGRVVAARGGRELSWDVSMGVRDLNGTWRGESLSGMRVGAESRGSWRGAAGVEVSRARIAFEGAADDSAVAEASGRMSAEGDAMKLAVTAGRNWLRRAAEGRIDVSAGRLGGEVEISTRQDGRGSGRWHAKIEGLAAKGGIFEVAGAQFDTAGDIDLAGGRATLRTGRASIWPGADVPAGELALQGLLWSGSGETKVEARLSGWRADNLKRVLAAPFAQRLKSAEGLEGLLAVEKAGGTWRAGGMAVLRKALFTTGLAARQPAGVSDAQVSLRAVQRGDRFEIEEGWAALDPVAEFENRLAIKGWIAAGFGRFDLRVQGKALDPAPVATLVDPRLWTSREDASGKTEEGPGPGAGSREAAAVGGAREREPDRRLDLSIEKLRLWSGDTAELSAVFVGRDGRWGAESVKMDSGGGRLEGRYVPARSGRRWEARATAKNFPASVWAGWAPQVAEALEGRVTGEASWNGMEGAGLQSLGGAARLRWTGARIEKLPPVRSLLKSAAKRVSPELGNCRFTEVTGSIAGTEGSWRTEDLALAGDLMRLGFSGSVDWQGKIEGQGRFAGRTDVMKRAQVRLGDVEVGGSTFVSFGRAEGDFTVLPGTLPLKGGGWDEVDADWEGWLRSAGLGGLAGFLDGAVKERRDRDRDGRKDGDERR